MSERERSRSRSPARDGEGGPPTDNGAPPSNENGGPPASGGADEVKLYVGNLDYGTLKFALKRNVFCIMGLHTGIIPMCRIPLPTWSLNWINGSQFVKHTVSISKLRTNISIPTTTYDTINPTLHTQTQPTTSSAKYSEHSDKSQTYSSPWNTEPPARADSDS